MDYKPRVNSPADQAVGNKDDDEVNDLPTRLTNVANIFAAGLRLIWRDIPAAFLC
jgi:hypothetical protein